MTSPEPVTCSTKPSRATGSSKHEIYHPKDIRRSTQRQKGKCRNTARTTRKGPPYQVEDRRSQLSKAEYRELGQQRQDEDISLRNCESQGWRNGLSQGTIVREKNCCPHQQAGYHGHENGEPVFSGGVFTSLSAYGGRWEQLVLEVHHMRGGVHLESLSLQWLVRYLPDPLTVFANAMVF